MYDSLPTISFKTMTTPNRYNPLSYGLRWLAVLPSALLGSLLATFLLHLVLYNTLRNFVNPYPELPERVLSPFVIAMAFVWFGARIAPAHKTDTAAVLLAIWILLIGVFLGVVIFGGTVAGHHLFAQGKGIAPAMAFFGALSGFLLVRKQSDQPAVSTPDNTH